MNETLATRPERRFGCAIPMLIVGLFLLGLALFLNSPRGREVVTSANTWLQGGTPAPEVVDPANAQASLNGNGTATVIPPVTTPITVRVFVKSGNSLTQQPQDAYVGLGIQNGGFGTFESAKVQLFAQNHGLTSVDVIVDQDAPNLSIVFLGNIPLADILTLQRDLQSPRIGIVYNNGLQGTQAHECMSFTERTDLGAPIRYHVYDRADWTLLPVLTCPNPR